MRKKVVSGQWLVVSDKSPQDDARAARAVRRSLFFTSHKPLATSHYSRGFTLIELLITMMIIAMMASMILFALYRAQETAKEQKTRSLIAKLDAIVKARWESYKTRRVPIVIPPLSATFGPIDAARMRLDGLRELMRMELPDRWTDVVTVNPMGAITTTPANRYTTIAHSSVWNSYYRRVVAANAVNSTYPTGEFAGAECLYLIVMASLAEDGDAREVFKPDNIGDIDGDTMPEFLDGWGRPIKFLRWAPGFQESELQVVLRATASGGGSTLNLSGPGLSTASGSYLGGAIFGLQSAVPASPPNAEQPVMFDVAAAARISGYQSTSPSAATVTLPSTPATPITGNVVIMAPDPFDPVGVYAASATPSFALYPLIYSSGPDRCYGILTDFEAGSPLDYGSSTVKMNPFFSGTENVAPSVTGFIGTARNDNNEQNYVPSGWVDNIHNHLQGLK